MSIKVEAPWALEDLLFTTLAVDISVKIIVLISIKTQNVKKNVKIVSKKCQKPKC